MKDYELKAETGKYMVSVQPIEMFAFGELVLDVRGPFFEHMATFMVAWAGLMSAFDEARYGNHMDSIAERPVGKIRAKTCHSDHARLIEASPFSGCVGVGACWCGRVATGASGQRLLGRQ